MTFERLSSRARIQNAARSCVAIDVQANLSEAGYTLIGVTSAPW